MAPLRPEKSKSNIPPNPPSYEDLASAKAIDTTAQRPELASRIPSFQGLLNVSPLNSGSGAPKKKNVPYRPSKELQKHINKLGSPSAESITSVTSGTKTEYFDVLPSFHMFQSILKRNDFEFDETSLGCPPVYGDTTHSSPTPPALSPVGTSTNLNQILSSDSDTVRDFAPEDDEYEDANEGQYLFTDNEEEDGLQSRARSAERASLNNAGDRSRSHSRNPLNGVINHESYGHSVLDNIDMLPHAKTSPLSIDIYVTKNVPVPNATNELEIKLKEYSCGDRVNGYVVITNHSDKDVDFGLFTVSLEGTVKAVDSNSNSKTAPKKSKVLLKKFLKMYDLSASYNDAVIPSSAGIEYAPYSVDTVDGCIMGLPDSRILKGNTKYKKFITFKFPEMLLDNACPHTVMRHTMPPPSFGIDGLAFNGKAGLVEVNKALGYGFLNVRGGPVKVRDYAFDDLSVSYTIEAKFIDKRHEPNQNKPVFPHDINDPNNDSKYIISKSAQYFLRFIPDIRTQTENYSRTYKLFGQDTFESIGIDGMLYNNLTSGSTWKFIRHMNLSILSEIETALDKLEFSNDELKRKHLRIGESAPLALEEESLIRPTQSKLQVQNPDSDRLQYYHERRMICNRVPVEIYGKRKKRLLSTSVKTGFMTVYVKVPSKLISYTSPRLLQKYNNGSEMSLTPVTSKEGFIPLHTSLSNMEELYNRDDESVLKSVDIELIFDNIEDTVKPPSISSVEFNIVAWSYRTDYPIPVSFEHDFFYTKPFDPTVIVRDDDVDTTKNNLQELKDTVNQHISFLKETKTYISQNTYSYLKGISQLGIKKDTIKDYFQSLSLQSNPWLESEGSWEAHQLSTKNLRWVKRLNVPLNVINKNNVTLDPSFQSCLVGRLYALQVVVKFKGAEDPANMVKVDVPVLVG
ncbi:putative ubiquitin ligase-binding protein [Clavispora lusitaniae]|uniref:Ubiquitin ligase-binding protein n=1 Tax=Clavispora lusitaniae TaxID=36911 RepID=A0ACD0WI53_CLALS|nr:putative ubiquitin ligase-binding protein [Clavispora lusitaniae]QFZ32651.1 putative ubiquitin ligase-binding protein [Clavispora lusitaniae]QFZ38320.1 putative ubiquitin ligase-binding protein [Clavispora lusitaniae]QFZ44003.1 putative ubiquitin ligase-binding protein [Clavispora lusitaniae]QFZ49680.1 putative ubiquitin ligase-binding protein [Clavispora lusitaniae]